MEIRFEADRVEVSSKDYNTVNVTVETEVREILESIAIGVVLEELKDNEILDYLENFDLGDVLAKFDLEHIKQYIREVEND